jgi:hypothetical protein
MNEGLQGIVGMIATDRKRRSTGHCWNDSYRQEKDKYGALLK